jgi:hypothetical protein
MRTWMGLWTAPRSRVDGWLTWAGQARRGRSPGETVRRRAQHGPLDRQETGLSEQRKYRSWTAQQKLEIVLAGMRGDRSVRDVCRELAIVLDAKPFLVEQRNDHAGW